MQVYFIDNDDYFQNRLETADENGVEYEDNDSRAIFYARGVLETVKKLRWCPDIIHCHGWMTALAPLYIKKAYKDEPSFRDAKVVFSVFEDDFKESFNADFVNRLVLKGVTKKDVAHLKAPVDYATLCKLAIDYADGIIQQSEKVNEEVMEYARQSGKPILEYQTPKHLPMLVMSSTTKYGKQNKNKQDNKENYESEVFRRSAIDSNPYFLWLR